MSSFQHDKKTTTPDRNHNNDKARNNRFSPVRRTVSTPLSSSATRTRRNRTSLSSTANASHSVTTPRQQRWSSSHAARHVQTQKQQQQQHDYYDECNSNNNNSEQQLAADRIWQLLRQRRADFARARQNNNATASSSRFQTPLLSRHNATLLRRRLSDFSWIDGATATRQQWRLGCVSEFCILHNTIFRKNNNNDDHLCRPSRWNCFVGLVRLLALAAVVTAAATSTAIVYSAQWLRAATAYVVTAYLIDWPDVQRHYVPDVCFSIVAGLKKFYHAVDATVLQGHRYAGREWNRDGFCWNNDFGNDNDDSEAPQTTSRQQSLWKLPPPPLERDERSQKLFWRGTRRHVAAIDYCYRMLEQEHARKQEKKRRKKQQQQQQQLLLHDIDISHSDDRSLEDAALVTESGNNNNNSGKNNSLKIRTDPELTVEKVLPSNQTTPREAIEMQVGASPPHKGRRSSLDGSTTTLSDGGVLSDDDDDERPGSPAPALLNFSDLTEGAADDLNWIDVGAKIGLRLLNSEHLQRAVASQETKDRILETMGNLDAARTSSSKNKSSSSKTPSPPSSSSHKNAMLLPEAPATEPRALLSRRPMHSMWTSPAAAAAAHQVVLASNSYAHDDSLTNNTNITSTTAAAASEEEPMSTPAVGSFPLLTSQTFPSSPVSFRRKSLPTLSPPRGSRHREELGFPPDNDDDAEEKDLKTPRNGGSTDSPESRCAASPPGIQRMSAPPFPEIAVTDAKQHAPTTTTTRDRVRLKRAKPKPPAPVHSKRTRREPLAPGVRVAVPLVPVQYQKKSTRHQSSAYQLASVVSSKRIYVGDDDDDDERVKKPSRRHTNCLSVTVKLEKFFLRDGEFAELTFRVMDEWGPRYMPRHSKVPIGSCIATTFGVGVLVGWRVEDDVHVVRSLWQCRGPGTGHAYLNRHAIHSTIEAAVGFRVETMYGWGDVISCTRGGRTYGNCRFLVLIKEDCRHKGRVLELHRKEIISCHGAQFMPVIEHIREAAHYQIQLDNYNAALREQLLLDDDSAPTIEQEFLHSWTSCAEILWDSFLKAVEEDKDFDDGVNNFMTSIINFLDRLDQDGNGEVEVARSPSPRKNPDDSRIPFCAVDDNEIEVQLAPESEAEKAGENNEPGFWIMNDLFGGVFKPGDANNENRRSDKRDTETLEEKASYYEKTFAALRTIMKTVTFARAASVDHPHFRLALAIAYDFLLFVRTIVKIQQRNTSAQSLKVWRAAWDEIVLTFGPIKERLESIGRGIAHRMEDQGRKAKIRVLRFADKLLSDERLLFALEQGEWDRCLARIEIALVEAQVIEEDNLMYYRKAARFVYDHIQMTMNSEGGAAVRNNEKLALLAHLIQLCAAPRRSILKLFCRDDMLELLERILVRSYYKEEVATRMLTIHAANFHSLRHLRMLKDFSVAGRIWIPLLDAADEEFSWLVSNMPENSKSIMCPLSSLFSLCVAQFHKICAGDLSKDWLAFLMEEESVQIIHDIDMMLILALESFSRDVREMMTVLPYYPSIEDDILNLMDEVNLDEFLRETSDAIDDPEKFSQYIREKATVAIERFLNYLPKMSIPVERRDLGDGWVLTCHGHDGGGLTLSDVNIKRENLVCQVMGGDTLFFPVFSSEEEDYIATAVPNGSNGSQHPLGPHEEESILDHIRVLLENAQRYGCWEEGVGGVGITPTDHYAASVLQGLTISHVLNCGIELWRNLEIDDDELLEIAIQDISYHIQLQEEHEKKASRTRAGRDVQSNPAMVDLSASESLGSQVPEQLTASSSSDCGRHRFNPRIDPTVLFLEIRNLNLNLDNFFFRIEKGVRKTIFDPIFDGQGMLSLRNVTIRLRVECAKERVKSSNPGADMSTPILQLRNLDVKLDKLQMKVKDTGFGSDWVLNKAVQVFEKKLTEIVEGNLKEQIHEQAQNAIENINSYFLMNPDLLLNLLGISMDDLDENVVWV